MLEQPVPQVLQELPVSQGLLERVDLYQRVLLEVF
jgi:hypothetical protein